LSLTGGMLHRGLPRGAFLTLICATLASAADENMHCEELLELASRVHERASVDLPTLVLVGHRNDGKSSLFEALLGLKLTNVGNDAFTRRPLRVHAHHDETAAEPVLYLLRNGQDERVRPEELRAYLESENTRLDDAGTYEAEPVRVRLVWKHAPSLVLIDTPGLIGETDNEALRAQRELVQDIVSQQISPAKRLILCLEDTSDWAITHTMSVVACIDPELRRTILVGTKLDAKMAQVREPQTTARGTFCARRKGRFAQRCVARYPVHRAKRRAARRAHPPPASPRASKRSP